VAQLTIVPTMIEYALHREAYRGLLDALDEAGHDVRFDDPDEREEYRSVPGDVAQAVADVYVFVHGPLVDVAALATIVDVVRRTLRRRERRRREAIIYGPRGDELERVPLNDDDD
jgi:hypothetical protein